MSPSTTNPNIYNMETKICRECKRELPLDNFYRGNGGKHGRVSICKECYKTYHNAWLEATKKKTMQLKEQGLMPKTKVCSKCGRELPLSEFYNKSKYKYGVSNWCKECDREYNKNCRARVKEAKKLNNPKTQNQMTTNFEKLFSEMIQTAVLKPIEEMLKTKFENLPSAPAPVQEPPKMKVCDCCGKEKPEADFVKGNDKIGLHNLCRDCSTILASNTRGEWGEGKMKCPSCGAVKSKEEFCFESNKFYLCKDCHDAIASNPYLYYPTEKLIQELKALKDETKHS